MKALNHILLIAVVIAVSACTGQRALYKHAEDLTSGTKVVLQHHNAAGETVLAMRADPTVSATLKVKLRDFYRKTVCSKDELSANVGTEACRNGPSWVLQRAAEAYETIRSPQNEQQLQQAIIDLTAALTALINLT